jgi:deazaflavin-dependent oxidoreductase (nitroreductase family)
MAPTTRLRFLAPITTRVFNPVIRLFAGRLPGLGIVTHTGRTTGRIYRTPLLVLRRGDHYVMGLWYGSDVHWVKNIVAAGRCGLRIRGRDLQLHEPELLVDPDRRLLPPPLRLVGRLVRLTEFLQLRVGDGARS